jgi:hypothetical protein
MRLIIGLAAVIAALCSTACTPLTLAWADMDGSGAAAQPPIFSGFGGASPTLAQWRDEEAPRLRRAFETHVYGAMPDASETRVLEHRVLDEAAFGGLGRLEEYKIEAKATFGGVTRSTLDAAPDGLIIDLLTPVASEGPAPVIVMEAFCPRWHTIPDPKVSRPADLQDDLKGPMFSVMTFIFGRYICTPPVEEILKRGYGIAAIYPGEAVPDETKDGLAALATLSEGHADDRTRWGAIAAWAWIFSRATDVLTSNAHVGDVIAWGHSRYGKAALVAAAYDPRIDAVISHQSGTGGASLNKRKKGESVKGITEEYPHWFAQSYAEAAGREEEMPIDQHQLLALIAPRPVLLGNARRDVWSDPNGAYRAALAADPVWELSGSQGLTQNSLGGFDPEADLSFWIRPGTHGVVKEDWPAFLDFLDAHFKSAKN